MLKPPVCPVRSTLATARLPPRSHRDWEDFQPVPPRCLRPVRHRRLRFRRTTLRRMLLSRRRSLRSTRTTRRASRLPPPQQALPPHLHWRPRRLHRNQHGLDPRRSDHNHPQCRNYLHGSKIHHRLSRRRFQQCSPISIPSQCRLWQQSHSSQSQPLPTCSRIYYSSSLVDAENDTSLYSVLACDRIASRLGLLILAQSPESVPKMKRTVTMGQLVWRGSTS